ncbi:hypothetical protein [Vibrio sp. D431a]|uniref:hypothetical protein n=1 Tax=Vibrio sp. D431a TaxID=2837388 RepID=UPI002557A6E9|nr:hypothetical protein [Vibrio sp. D431a]MDK9789963.1 hypothetical protein [Vibrio sp. D431a]
MNTDHLLKRHVREEKPFSDEAAYEHLQKKYPAENHEGIDRKGDFIKVYRGMNLNSKAHHTNTMNSLNQDGYSSVYAASWSPDFEEAKGFAESRKSYYLTEEIASSHTKMVNESEEVAGYGGIILEAWVHKDNLLDVTASDYAIEEEFLLRPNTVVFPDKIHEIKTYRRQIEDGDLDINQELIKHKGDIDEPVVSHILRCHLDKTTKATAEQLFDIGEEIYMKTLSKEANFEITEDFRPADRDVCGYVYYDAVSKEKILNVVVPYTLITLADKGMFNKEQFEEVREIVDDCAEYCIELMEETGIDELGYCQNYLLAYASPKIKDALYFKICQKYGDEIRDITSYESIREINKHSGDEGEFKARINEFAERMRKATTSINSKNIPDLIPEERTLNDRKVIKPSF